MAKETGKHAGAERYGAPIKSGLVAGSRIWTLDGALPVEHLYQGDRVITRDGGMDWITATRSRRISGKVVHIPANALGIGCPEHDLTLPAGQNILLRGGRARLILGRDRALVPAFALTDAENITLSGARDLCVFDVSFARNHVIYVEGLEITSATPSLPLEDVA